MLLIETFWTQLILIVSLRSYIQLVIIIKPNNVGIIAVLCSFQIRAKSIVIYLIMIIDLIMFFADP